MDTSQLANRISVEPDFKCLGAVAIVRSNTLE